jgi:hypothetical protein
MGPVVDPELKHWQLRPFQTSTTFANLRRDGLGVFHVTDDVLLIVQTALSLPLDLPPIGIRPGGGWIIESACHWYCLEIKQWQLTNQRSLATAEVIEQQQMRPFWGWNRAKHAVLEATILATRLHLVGPEQIAEDLARLNQAVEKTAGPREFRAWGLVTGYIRDWS